MTQETAATPETGTAPVPAEQPEKAPAKPERNNYRTDDEYEMAMLDAVLEPQAEATQEAPPTDEATPEPEPQPEESEGESEEPDNWTPPETIEELAEQLDIPPDKILASGRSPGLGFQGKADEPVALVEQRVEAGVLPVRLQE